MFLNTKEFHTKDKKTYHVLKCELFLKVDEDFLIRQDSMLVSHDKSFYFQT